MKALAIGLWCAFVAVLGAAIYVGLNPTDGGDPIVLGDAIWASSFIGFPTAGALIAIRLPRRPLGWIFLVGPLCIMTGVFLGDGPVEGGTEAARYVAVGANVCFTIGMTSLLLIPLFMPDGRLAGRRWRPILKGLLVVDSILLLRAIFEPGRLTEHPEFTNPFGIEALRPLAELVRRLEGPILLGVLVVGIASVLMRRKAATGRERQQMKWLALGLGVVMVCVFTISVGEAFSLGVPDWFATFIYAIAFLALPVSIGIAILRTGLYDVDVIINRALVYGALTAILVGFYLLVILAFRNLLPLSSDSDLSVAGSTLLVAGLFQPVRIRLQRFIDRRFYRSKYNAVATLDEFTSRLRDEVELERVRSDMIAVVSRTVQPTHASLWLRTGP